MDQNGYSANLSFQQQLATAAQFSGPGTNYAFTHPAIASTSAYSPSTRTDQTQSGYFGGIMYPRPGSPYVATGTTTLQTSALDSRVAAVFTGSDPLTASTSGINSLTINFGAVGGARAVGRSAFIDDNIFGAIESAGAAAQINGVTLPASTNQANASELGLVSSATVTPSPTAFPGVGFCDCQYLKWGYWTGEINQANSTNTAATRSDRAFINTFVAGVPTGASDVATLAGQAVTASYSGHAIGSVANNGTSYVAAGNFNASYNFATKAGSLSISNFDGRNVTGAVGALTGSSYSGALSGQGTTGQFGGTFYGPMAANTGGNFAFRSTSATLYFASGIFAGKR